MRGFHMQRYRWRIVATALSLLAASAVHARADGRSRGAAKPGQTFTECRHCPEMMVVPAGTFTIGSPPDEPLRRDNEPQKKITFEHAFAIARTAVTWDQWEACVRDRRCDGAAIDIALRTGENGEPNPDYKDWGRGTRPVVGVSWYDAQAFVGWLNEKTGEDDAYRLPSEAEWEYAARAGSSTAFPWGAVLDYNHGNFGVAEGGLGGKAEGRDVWVGETAPVASFPPNAFGLYDMHGNTFEWTEDCYESRPRAHARGRLGEQTRQLREPRLSQWHVHEQRVHAALGKARRAVSGDAARAQLLGVSRRKDVAGIALKVSMRLSRPGWVDRERRHQNDLAPERA